jgi:hypothetical protein
MLTPSFSQQCGRWRGDKTGFLCDCHKASVVVAAQRVSKLNSLTAVRATPSSANSQKPSSPIRGQSVETPTRRINEHFETALIKPGRPQRPHRLNIVIISGRDRRDRAAVFGIIPGFC